MAYEIDWSTSDTPDELPGKTHISLLPNTTDTRNLTSLVLFGKGAPNYGEGQQENFLRILENFASPTAPVNPTIGQLWYNSDDARLYILDINNNWVPITGVWVAETAPSTPFLGQLWFKDSTNSFFIYGGDNIWVPLNDNPTIRVGYNWEYNQFVDKYNAIVASNNIGTSCADTYGWNQPSMALSKLYIPANPVTNTEWMFILNKWKEIAPIVGIDPNKFADRGFIIEDQYHIDETLGPTGEGKGIATVLNDYDESVAAANSVYANRFNFNVAAQEMQSYPSVNRTSYWTDETYLDIVFQWADAASMHSFFMTGGYIKLTPTFNQQTVDATSNIWAALISALGGGILIKGCATIDQAGNTIFTTARSIFELPDSNVAWPVTAPADSIGKTLYKANDMSGSNFGGGTVIPYNSSTPYNSTIPYVGSDGGYGGGGGYGSSGNDSDLGWADITVEARRQLSAGSLQIRIAFDNETGSQVKGILGCNLAAFKASSTWLTFVPANVPTFPTIASSMFI